MPRYLIVTEETVITHYVTEATSENKAEDYPEDWVETAEQRGLQEIMSVQQLGDGA